MHGEGDKKVTMNGLYGAGRSNRCCLIAGLVHLLVIITAFTRITNTVAFTSSYHGRSAKLSMGDALITTIGITKPPRSKIIKFNFQKKFTHKLPKLLPVRLSAQDSITSSDETNRLSVAVAKIRSLTRKVTGLSFTSMRAAGRAMTGFSLTALRISLRSAMSQPITSLLHWFISLFPIWFRFIYQPFLMLYYWPLFMIQNLLGPSKNSKREALSTHEALVQSWREAVEAAEKANMGEMWPIHVTDSGQIRLSFPVGNDENSLLRGEFMEFLDVDEEEIGALTGNTIEGVVEKEVVVLDKPYVETDEDIKVALVESVEDAIAEGQPTRPTNELQRIIPPWERSPSELRKIAITQPKTSPSLPSIKLSATTSEITAAMELTKQEEATEPIGPRWAVAAKTCNLSGVWKLLDSDEFKSQYDKYLLSLGQPAIVRTVALSLIGFTREEIIQEDDGRKLTINGVNPRGIWNRILISSGAEVNKPSFQPIYTEIYSADSEKVDAEAWWEGYGTVHKSWLRGGMRYGGGDFESSRYLASENVLICKSVFHPKDPKREKAQVTWRFQREGSS